MTLRIRPNRLGYIIAALLTLPIGIYYLSTQNLFNLDHLSRLNILFSPDTPISFLSSHNRNQSVFTDPEASKILQENILRINLAQTYENARLAIISHDGEENEEEGHEDYISRLSTFVLEHFTGSKAREYLIAMLTGLNDHISPPLLKIGLRKGMIKVVGDNRRSRKRGTAAGEEWEMNVFDRQGMDRGLWALSKGSEKLEAMWRNLTGPDDRKVLLKYLALLLWGGAYAEDDQLLRSIHLESIARTATSALDPSIVSIRQDLQLLAPPPPPVPDFTPPSLDPTWTTAEQPEVLKEIGLVIHRQAGATWVDRFPLSTDTIMAKAFHPVFLDIVQRINVHMDGSSEDRKPLDDIRLFHDAVDRYLHVQYGISVEDLIYKDQDLQIGDVLLLRSRK